MGLDGDPPQLHGPYLTWTRKVDNKMVTRTLDLAQAEPLRPLLDSSRRLRELVSELEAPGSATSRKRPRSTGPLTGLSARALTVESQPSALRAFAGVRSVPRD
ncbi:MAG: DUF6788 family protein [Dermatophilaceae bacterium]